MAVSRAMKCDNCDTVEMLTIPQQDALTHEGMPVGWIRLFVNNTPRYRWKRSDLTQHYGSYDLCSSSCAYDVLLKIHLD